MAEPSLQPYLRFLYINKRKATCPLNVLGVYYLNLLPKSTARLPDALLFPCCMEHVLKFSCADHDLGLDSRQIKSTSLSHWDSHQAGTVSKSGSTWMVGSCHQQGTASVFPSRRPGPASCFPRISKQHTASKQDLLLVCF